MPKGRRAKQLKQEPQAADQAGINDLPPELRDDTPIQGPPPEGRQPGDEPDDQSRSFQNRVDPGPRGRHTINLGDGRELKFSRWDRFQQTRIQFIAKEEGIDVRPSKEDTEFMKQHGYRWRGGEEMAWTRQLFTQEDKDQITAVEEQKGKPAASALRSQIRGDSDRIAQEAFVALANRIRARNSLEAVDYSFAQDQGRGA